MTRRERMEARAARREEWAESRRAKAEAADSGARALAEGIPFGQPVMGRRDAAVRARIRSGTQRSWEHGDMARRHEAKASGIRHQLDRSIYSDDPDALDRLHERLAHLEARRAAIKAYNRSARKGCAGPEMLDPEDRRHIVGPGPLPGYVLSNLGGVIRSTAARIQGLEDTHGR